MSASVLSRLGCCFFFCLRCVLESDESSDPVSTEGGVRCRLRRIMKEIAENSYAGLEAED